jgi:antitoxin ParD1/3/4
MARTTSFTLGEELECFVQQLVESGAYSSASEVVRTALTRLSEEQRKVAELHTALDRALRVDAQNLECSRVYASGTA